ncbi:MAG: zinc-binding dehydrogenase, partial [Lawsonibacter sp.]|nr:zinc-binding dehydrogenase [Lawsonibacter sp.]
REMGFEVVNAADRNIEEYCKSRTGGNGFDWVIDCAGVQPVANMLLDAVKVHGHILVIAAYAKPASMPFIKGMFKEVTIEFTRVYRFKDFAIAAQIMDKDPNFEKVITHVLPADEAQKGFDLATTKGSNSIKVMYTFD